MYDVVACIFIPINFCYSDLLLCCAVKGYSRKATAILERRTADKFYAYGYSYACKFTATAERRTEDVCYAVGYGYARKTTATAKRRIINTCYTVGYIYACKTTAIIERRLSDTCYRFAFIFGGNYYFRFVVYSHTRLYGITRVIIVQNENYACKFTANTVAVRKVVRGVTVF